MDRTETASTRIQNAGRSGRRASLLPQKAHTQACTRTWNQGDTRIAVLGPGWAAHSRAGLSEWRRWDHRHLLQGCKGEMEVLGGRKVPDLRGDKK